MTDFEGAWGGRWTLDPAHQLGERGGFGSVFIGQSVVGEPIAVKVVQRPPDQTDPMFDRLRLREVEIAEKMRGSQSQHLIEVLDVAMRGDDLLIVMPLADGSLKDRLENQLTPDEALEIFKQVAAGLRELHQLAIIHRDLKPRNILSHAGVWKLADFGIARDTEIGTQTATFLGAGTWAYMAPELFDLQSPTIKTDLYALGCLGFELFAHRRPFTGPDFQSYRRQHREDSPDLSIIANPTVRSLIGRLLSKDPSARQQDARAVQDRLARVAITLPPELQRLQQIEAQHVQEQSQEAAVAAQAAAASERRRQLIAQAISDLEEICEEGVALIQNALPDVTITPLSRLQRNPLGLFPGSFVGIADSITRVAVSLWEPEAGEIRPEDTLLLAGAVNGSNRRHTGLILANIACEIVEGSLTWKVYRFTASVGLRPNVYAFGPEDRTHGFDRRTFMNERVHMLSSAFHIWQLRKAPFSPEEIVALFTEASAL